MSHTRSVRRVAATGLSLTAVLAMAACGGSDSSSSSSAAALNWDQKGPITYVQGKDNNNVVQPLVDKWNAAHPDEKVTFIQL